MPVIVTEGPVMFSALAVRPMNSIGIIARNIDNFFMIFINSPVLLLILLSKFFSFKKAIK